MMHQSRRRCFLTARHQSHRRLSSTTTNKRIIQAPLVIVGGGPSGLLLSNLLSHCYETPHLLVEAASYPKNHPQAHFMNTRTMEILNYNLPHLYARIKDAMPHVEEWRYFSFGYSASNHFARAVHPVDQPLAQNQDANGVLLSDNTIPPTPVPTEPLSECSVGHLAQHLFTNLLYESAQTSEEATILLDTPIVDITSRSEGGMHRLSTASGTVIETPLVVAADGSSSLIRQAWKIETVGNDAMQHLVNVHFTATEPLEPAAMLYAIYNETTVAMMVRHSAHEYVLQIPYFPPYQTMEQHFTQQKVAEMLTTTVGSANTKIHSIRPWRMACKIANRYISSNKGGVLMGDAAHVFPPAGGFGMNTGLQDAHSLAWRLALICSTKRGGDDDDDDDVANHFEAYEKERRAVAQENAALSVRNYQRVLDLSKACYLNDQHPTLLCNMLDGLGTTLGVSLERRQDMFQTLLQTALSPLSALKNSSQGWYAQHVTSNLRKILKQGGGLPLLFPKYELGFGYGADEDSAISDSMGYTPRVKVGYLIPHVPVIECSSSSSSSISSTADLPAQLNTTHEPTFVLLAAEWEGDIDSLIVAQELGGACLNVKVVVIVREEPTTTPAPNDVTVLWDKTGRFLEMMVSGKLVAIRPDGHIMAIADTVKSIHSAFR